MQMMEEALGRTVVVDPYSVNLGTFARGDASERYVAWSALSQLLINSHLYIYQLLVSFTSLQLTSTLPHTSICL